MSVNAFSNGWLIAKDFRFLDGPGYARYVQAGGYDPETDEAFVNLRNHVSGFKMEDPDSTPYYTKPQVFRDDQDLIDRIVRILSHESAHQAMYPPYTDDVFEAASMRGLPPAKSKEEREMRQAKVDDDFERFHEYGAWSATPGVDDDERRKMLALYGVKV